MSDASKTDKPKVRKEAPKDPPITKAELAWLDQALGLERFFEAWSPDGIQKLLPSFRLRAFKKGTEIVKEGDEGTEMFVLYKGSVGVKRKRMLLGSKTVAALKPGDFFGEIAFLVNAPRSATIAALEDSLVFSWSSPDMHRVLEQNEDAAKKLESAARERMAKLAE